MSDRPILTLCLKPFESVLTLAFLNEIRLNSLRISSIRESGDPKRRAKNLRLYSTEKKSKRFGTSGTKPMVLTAACLFLRLTPLTKISPLSGCIQFERIFNKVDFPAPLCPTMATSSPTLTSKLHGKSPLFGP